MSGIWMEITFTLEPQEYGLLRQKASEQSLEVSSLVRQIIRQFIGQAPEVKQQQA